MPHAVARSSGTPAAHGVSQYLTFSLGEEVFAVPIATIREVIQFHSLTRIPLAPAAVPGVLNLRGSVVPVVDLSARFGRSVTLIGRRTCVVVVEVRIEEALQPVGVLVDTVREALDAASSQLADRPAFGTGLRADFVAGMLNLDGRFVVVLDIAQVLSMQELEQLVSDAALARGSAPFDPGMR
jgi:purine-binding chemotaxis protein CheW